MGISLPRVRPPQDIYVFMLEELRNSLFDIEYGLVLLCEILSVRGASKNTSFTFGKVITTMADIATPSQG